MQDILKKLHPLEIAVLRNLKEKTTLQELVKNSDLKEVEVMRAIEWLHNKKLLDFSKVAKKVITLDKNGTIYLEKGLPEKRFLEALKSEKELSKEEIMKLAHLNEQEFNVSLGLLKKKLAVDILPGFKFKITKNGKLLLEKGLVEQNFLDKFKENKQVSIDELSPEDKLAYDSLRKRKDILKVIELKDWLITVAKETLKLKDELKKYNFADKLTQEMLKDGSWKDVSFRHFDVKVNVPKKYSGRIHFTNEAIDYIKRIWLDLGFREMTGNLIQSVFWDLDSLFVPQDHPARDMQDTFYLDDKYKAEIDKKILERVKSVHENGSDTGSKGWQHPFDTELSKKLILRTHTTVLSARTIATLKESDIPAKFFAVSKIFRNETWDWKHLFEFYQVEGIVVDPNANFINLRGYLIQFYKKMGYDNIRLRPAYFPYTEPSVEIEVYVPERDTWLELGGAGIFRPEVTKTLIGKEIPVLAWGLGFARIIVPYFNIKDVREIYKNDLQMLRNIKRFIKF
ncbi:MAG: phenylalanyl-tRNA synthetase alpha chain [Candidatus Woesearchaeota archaeon]|nr:phenylalanyl-tRNA synthetase alpha chain [Candidatus Woesearchaeota archaeon]